MVINVEDWAIRRRLTKSAMAGHVSVSETERVWVINEGLATRRWLKIQSGHPGNLVDVHGDEHARASVHPN
jgi:hypothetical protein